MGGYRGTGAYRFRNRLIFGAVLEELIEHSDGRQEWRKAPFPVHADELVDRRTGERL